jgi:hypothetical protein
MWLYLEMRSFKEATKFTKGCWGGLSCNLASIPIRRGHWDRHRHTHTHTHTQTTKRGPLVQATERDPRRTLPCLHTLVSDLASRMATPSLVLVTEVLTRGTTLSAHLKLLCSPESLSHCVEMQCGER